MSTKPETRFDPWIGKIPWRRKWQNPLQYSCLGKPWTEEPGGLQSMGLQLHYQFQAQGDRSGIIVLISLFFFIFYFFFILFLNFT